MNKNLKTIQNDEKMHYKITIFGACTPYPRLIYWIATSISQGKKDDMSSKSRPWLLQFQCFITVSFINIINGE